MSRKAVDVKAEIEKVRGLSPGFAAVANLAEIGLAVCEAVRKGGGLPRARGQGNGTTRPARQRKPSGGVPAPTTGTPGLGI